MADGNLVQPGPLAGNRVVGNTITDSLLDGIRVKAGAVNSTLTNNSARHSGEVDGRDDNADCDHNDWRRNSLGTVNLACVAGPPAVVTPIATPTP